MTTTQESPAQNNIELAIAREPRLQAVGNETLRSFIASQMIALNLSFEAAEASVLGLIQGADTYKAEVKASIEAERTESESTVKDTLQDLILETLSSLTTVPQYGLTISFDPRHSFKNSDGSPMMDAQNNPVVKPFVDFNFHWENKARATGASRNITNTSNMGRPEGDYVIEGESEVFKSMAAFAKAKWPDEFSKFEGKSRDFLTSKGYVVPAEATSDSDGNKHWMVTLSNANGVAA